MASRNSRATIDHDEIRQWAEERGARPSTVRGTSRGEEAGILRLDFPGYTGEDTLEEISWEEWLEKFDNNNLALVYQETTAGGVPSNFNKIVSREMIDLKTGEKKKAPGQRARRGAGARATGTRRAAGTRGSTRKAATGTRRTTGKRKAAGTRTKTTAKKTTTKKRGATTRRASTGRRQTMREVAAKGGRASASKRRGSTSTRKRTSSRSR